LQLFIDTANTEEIRELGPWGILSGVTTNPSLLARERRSPEEVIGEISRLVPGPISAEVISQDTDGMISEARELARLGSNIVVKIPMTGEGLAAVHQLAGEGIRSNVTLVFSPAQALLAARAGAAFISPFVGRLDDIGHDGLEVVRQAVEVIERFKLGARIIAASIRHPAHVTGAALAGAHIATVPYAVLKKMVGHPLTEQGIARFLSDWESLQVSITQP